MLICAFGGGRAAALDVELHAPPGCPSKAELEARVLSLISRKKPADREVHARIEITHADSGAFRLALRVVVGKQELSRSIEASACQSVCDAAAWLIAMAGAEPEEQPSQAKRALTVVPHPQPTRSAAAGPATSVDGARAPAGANSATKPRAPVPAAGAGGEPHTEAGGADSPAMAAGATAGAGVAGASAATPPEEPSRPRGSAAAAAERSEDHARETPRPERSEASLKSDSPTRPPQRASAALRPRWGRVGVSAGYFDAGLPHGAAAFAILGGYGRGPFYVQLRGLFALPVADSLAGSGMVRGRTGQLSLAGCLVWGQRWRGGPCLELRGARSVIEVSGVSEPGERSVLWLSGGPAAQLGFLVLGRWELVAEGGLGLPLTGRPRVSVEGRGEVLQASFVSGFAFLGTGARWP